jgi:hypothetical protein
MISFPYFLSAGLALYKDVIHVYPPLTVFLLFLPLSLTHFSPFILKVVFFILIFFFDVLIYKIVYQLTVSHKFSLFSIFLFFLLQVFYVGSTIWPDIFLALFILCAFFFFLSSTQSNRNTFLVGFFLLLATLTKQQGLYFVLLYLLFFIIKKVSIKKFCYFLLPIIIGWITLFIVLFLTDLLRDYFSWTVLYPFLYWRNFPGYVYAVFLKKEVFLFFFFFTIFAATQVFYKKVSVVTLLIWTSFCSLFLFYPRYTSFHMMSFICFSSICFSLFLFRASSSVKFFALGVFLLFFSTRYIHSFSFSQSFRFAEIQDFDLASSISTLHTKNVFLMGLPSSLYVYSNTLPPKPWLDIYSWYYEMPSIQNEVLLSWKISPPNIIVMSAPQDGNKFDISTYRPSRIMNYIFEHYVKRSEIAHNVTVWELK